MYHYYRIEGKLLVNLYQGAGGWRVAPLPSLNPAVCRYPTTERWLGEYRPPTNMPVLHCPVGYLPRERIRAMGDNPDRKSRFRLWNYNIGCPSQSQAWKLT